MREQSFFSLFFQSTVNHIANYTLWFKSWKHRLGWCVLVSSSVLSVLFSSSVNSWFHALGKDSRMVGFTLGGSYFLTHSHTKTHTFRYTKLLNFSTIDLHVSANSHRVTEEKHVAEDDCATRSGLTPQHTTTTSHVTSPQANELASNAGEFDGTKQNHMTRAPGLLCVTVLVCVRVCIFRGHGCWVHRTACVWCMICQKKGEVL